VGTGWNLFPASRVRTAAADDFKTQSSDDSISCLAQSLATVHFNTKWKRRLAALWLLARLPRPHKKFFNKKLDMRFGVGMIDLSEEGCGCEGFVASSIKFSQERGSYTIGLFSVPAPPSYLV
jgi:hypothetical protein